MSDQVTAAYSGNQLRYEVDARFKESAHVPSMEAYRAQYDRSVRDSEGFWREQAQRLDWIEPFTTLKDVLFSRHDVHIRWFEGGKLNACANCVDRHAAVRGDDPAILFEPDNPDEPSRVISWSLLKEEVCRFAGVLRKMGVQRGDRVTIYLPMIPEAVYAMLACARLGAIHSVVFAGFSPDSLADRILDCDSHLLITADEGQRGGRAVPLKQNADRALERCPEVTKVLVVRRTGMPVNMAPGRDVWYHDAASGIGTDLEPVPMESEDPLYILYTSGSTGKPKGVVHTTAGYLLFSAMTHELVFDYRPGDVFWCTADVGWVTGHSYIVYGPLANGATIVLFEGTPHYPDASRFWQVVDKHQVSIFYTAPTAIRALMREGERFVKNTDRSSLRVLGSVGEPINPEAWRWYHDVVGEGRCPVVDTWWQTETGGIMIAPLPAAIPQKPGSATLPFFGVEPEVLNGSGDVLQGESEGLLVMKSSWPGQARTVYGDHQRFIQTYFTQYDGYYYTGDGCRRDDEGYYWITGRVDDVLNISGHRIGTAEVESALVSHEAVAEAAVVGFPHDIKGQGIYAYVTLIAEVTPTEALRDTLANHVRQIIGGIARPDFIQFTEALPKTRSGKIMRRILRKIAANETDSLGDISTLADQGVVSELLNHRQNR